MNPPKIKVENNVGNNRSKNLDLIRWLNNGHKNTAKMLSRLTNENYISQMANGHMEINDQYARKIEKVLLLPHGWMDRDNISLLSMSEIDLDIYKLIKTQPEQAKEGLLLFLSLNKAD